MAARAGCADASSPLSAASAEVKLRWVPISSGGDHGGCALVLALRLSYRDVEELLAERGITVDHVTIYRWVQRFTPAVHRRRPAVPARHG
jgi:hypothetical protein